MIDREEFPYQTKRASRDEQIAMLRRAATWLEQHGGHPAGIQGLRALALAIENGWRRYEPGTTLYDDRAEVASAKDIAALYKVVIVDPGLVIEAEDEEEASPTGPLGGMRS